MPETENPSPISLTPLPIPTSNPALQRIRQPKAHRSTTPHTALVPLFYAALIYLAGIVFAHYQYLRPSWLLAGLAPLAMVAGFAIWKTPRLRWLPVAAIWLVLGIWSAETEPSPAANPAVAQLSDGLLRTVEGTVSDAGPMRNRNAAQEAPQDQEIEDPSEAAGEQVQRVDLRVAAAEVVTDSFDEMTHLPNAENAKLRLSILWPGGSARPVQCGQRVRVVVRILPPDTFHNPGAWSRATYLETQQITATASVLANKRDGGQPRLALLNAPEHSSVACLLNQARNSASTHLEALPTLTRNLPRALRATSEDTAMLTALLTGDRSYLTTQLRAGFERTGSFHLIVVSGLHLAILAGLVFALVRRLRLPRLPATSLTIAVSLAYALFTGFAIPAQRSFWMITLYLLGRLLYRSRSPLNVLSFATLALAAASPRSIFDASLQMTVLSVAAIAGVAIPLLERTLQARVKAIQDLSLISIDPKLPPRIAQFRVALRLIAHHLQAATSAGIAWKLFPFGVRTILRLGEVLFVGVVVELALALPMAIYFHRITVYALPVNLCILPLLGILVPSAMLLLLTLALWPAAAILPAALSLGTLHTSVFLVRKLGSLALGDLRIPNPTPVQIGLTILTFILAIQLARGNGLQRRLALATMALTAASALWPRPVDHPANALLFESIDVGQGDSLLLITPDGKTLLVDGGGLGFAAPNARRGSNSDSGFDVGEEVVSSALWSRGIRRLDAVALTHAHHDHMGGLPAILRNFHPTEFWVGSNPPVPAYKALLQEASSLGVRVRSFHGGEAIPFGQAEVRVLAPQSNYHPGAQPANNDSLVLQARYQSESILLAGDAEAPEEESILTGAGLPSTILKVGHHGSLTSTRPAFLAAIHPAWAVISCGRHNRFGHPRPEILAELQSAHTRTYRTDIDGATCFLLDGKAVTADPLCYGHW